MSNLVDPQTGALLDFDPRPGDSDSAWRARYGHARGHGRQRWGRRVQLATPNSGPVAPTLVGVKSVANLVSTEDLETPQPIFTLVRFAAALSAGGEDVTGTQQPPQFSRCAPNYGAALNFLKFTTSRVVDPSGVPTLDTSIVSLHSDANLNPMGDSVNFDTINCRQLDINVEMVGPPGTSVWVEALSSVIEEPSRLEKLTGYQFARVFAFAPTDHLPHLMLPARPARVQFIIVNQSPDSDLYVGFGLADPTVFPTFILPKNISAVYESPIGGYNGPITGAFIGGVPTGSGVITDGSYSEDPG